jgi:hypothetical protein
MNACTKVTILNWFRNSTLRFWILKDYLCILCDLCGKKFFKEF